MPGQLRTSLALLSCVVAIVVAAPAQAAHPVMESRLVERINDIRASHGLHQLRVGRTLSEGARTWARHLVRQDSFHHASLRSGTGEIIAWGTCSWFRPGQAVRMWLNSSGHRALIMRPGFRAIGTGWNRGPWRGYGCAEMAVARFR